jgi:hypothetical protein
METRASAMPKNREIIGTQDRELRQLLSFLIKQSQLSREQIADEMGKSLGQPNSITGYMLNDWTSEYHKGARFPALFIKPFCDAIGSDRLQRWAAGPRLRKLIEFAERHLELEERRAELLKAKPRRKAKPKRPRKS